jgi:hypothetical protein
VLEETRLKEIEDKKRAEEELDRLSIEEKKLETWKINLEEKISQSLVSMIEDNDWNSYSFCEEGYINVRKEKDLNGFIYDFKEKCTNFNFLSNFKLIEKNLQEEINGFDFSQIHYHNLRKLLIEGRACLELNKIRYALHYLNMIQDLEIMRIEAITRYFLENFHNCKANIIENMKKNNLEREDESELSPDWTNKNMEIKLAFWINSAVKNYRDTNTKFDKMNLKIMSIPRHLVMDENILRVFWTKNDIREIQPKVFCPYISVGGTFFLERLRYPKDPLQYRKWEVRDTLGENYINKDHVVGNFSYNIYIDIPKYVFLKGVELGTIRIGKYDTKNSSWVFLEGSDYSKFNQENFTFEFYSNELGIYSLLLPRNIFFPYESWYLRCIDKNTAILDLVTPRLKLVFEIGIKVSPTKKKDREKLLIGYVKLIENTHSEFSHFANKEMNYDDMLIEMRHCGILLTPDEEDLNNIGLKIKNYEAGDRALNDVIMACRQYAIKSNQNNKSIGENIILAKFKPNLEFDYKFFDDEEKDWFEVGWYFNKSVIGTTELKKGEYIFTPTIEEVNIFLSYYSSHSDKT